MEISLLKVTLLRSVRELPLTQFEHVQSRYVTFEAAEEAPGQVWNIHLLWNHREQLLANKMVTFVGS